MLPTNDAVLTAFQLLATTVRDLNARGVSLLGATLKPELRRRSGDSFSEQLLGFAKFGDFLRAAEASGFVKLTVTPGGDFQIWPTGVVPCSVQTRGETAVQITAAVNEPAPVAPTTIRQDLWNAFNSFSAEWVYDPATDLAFKPRSCEQLSTSKIPIPAGRDRVLNWMRSFANLQEAEGMAQLLAALDTDSATFQFSNAVKASSKLHSSWRRYHIQQVLAAIEAWAKSNNVRPKDIVRSATDHPGSAWRQQSMPATIAPVQAPNANEQPAQSRPTVAHALTPRLVLLVDELIEELIKFRGILEITGPKQ